MSKNYISYSSRSGLSDSDILDIRAAANRSVPSSIRNLAAEFSAPKSTIHDIITRKTWNHVPSPVTVYKNYSIFPDGRVMSNKTSKFLISKLDRDGNLNVALTINGKRETKLIASLIAKAFLGKNNAKKLTYRDNDTTNVHFRNIVTK